MYGFSIDILGVVLEVLTGKSLGEYLKENKELPDAVVCANDLMALGANYALYDEDARSVTVKKDTRVYNYSNDEENENFPLFIELCENGVIKKYEDNNYYFTNDYTFMPSKFGSNNTAKSSSINFLTNSSYNGKNKWQKLKD